MYGHEPDNSDDGDIPYNLSREDKEWLDRRNGNLKEQGRETKTEYIPYYIEKRSEEDKEKIIDLAILLAEQYIKEDNTRIEVGMRFSLSLEDALKRVNSKIPIDISACLLRVMKREKLQAKKSVRICSACGAELVLRRNKKTQEEFWGCSNFPKCRGPRKIYPDYYDGLDYELDGMYDNTLF